MLNRTNRTLSANLNRLNLGTRSLVLVTSLNNGNATLRVRHAHEDAMRDGMYRSSNRRLPHHRGLRFQPSRAFPRHARGPANPGRARYQAAGSSFPW